MVDADGTIRYRKEGGFSNANADDLEAVRRFASGEDPGPSPSPRPVPYGLGALERELVSTRMAYGQLLQRSGRSEDAIASGRERCGSIRRTSRSARRSGPPASPSAFIPSIDNDWQTQQLKLRARRGDRRGDLRSGRLSDPAGALIRTQTL